MQASCHCAESSHGGRAVVALAPGPLADHEPSGGEGCVVAIPSKRRRSSASAMQHLYLHRSVAHVAPQGCTLLALAPFLDLVAQERRHTFVAAYALDVCVHFIVDFFQFELEG